jgi:steroid 5-alpha reductase family enzyme
MTVLYLEALAAIAVSLSVLMAGAWVAQQRTGNSGWVDTIWTFSLGLVGAGSALWPVAGASPNARQSLVAALVPPLEAQMLRWRGDRYRDYQSRTSQFFPLPPQA